MNLEQARQLIGGYATGTLTKSERAALMEAALDDDSLFEALAQEEEIRGALADAEFRLKLRRRLHELNADTRIPFWGRFRVLLRPQSIAAIGLAASIVVIVLIRNGVIGERSTVARVVLAPGTVPALHAAGILEEPTEEERKIADGSRTEPPAIADGAWIRLDRTGAPPAYRAGDRMRIGFSVPAASNALLVEERADGSTYRLYPNRYHSSARVNAGETVTIPPAGQGDLTVEGAPGLRTLRLLVFPAATDPMAGGVSWSTVRGMARMREQQYEVAP